MLIYHQHIDELPLYNWLKINEGNLKYCRKNLAIGTKAQDEKHYEIIKETNYEEFGVDPEYLRLLNLFLKVSEARLDWVITGDNFIKNKIIRSEAEIEELIDRKKEGGGDVDESIILLGKWMGSRVDPKIVTVKEFTKMISVFKKEMDIKNKINGTGKN